MFSFTRWKIKRITKKIKALQNNRVHNQPSDQQLKREISYYFELASLYKKLLRNKKFPYASIMLVECYKNAANLNDSSAHYTLGHLLMEEAKYRQKIHLEGVFDDVANQKKYAMAFDEAHAHLLAAEKLEHIEAKRLRGLAIINGWGVVADKDAGFELVVESIEQEGSWDRVPQIFAAMGLNKPEFFAAIMQRRKVNL